MTLPILEGTDGRIRMGKSKGNYIALGEPAREQFGKTMSIPDDLIPRWLRLADFRPQSECDAVERGLRDGSRAPMDEKKKLAESIVTRYHGAGAAHQARDYFERTIQRKERPADMPEFDARAAEKVAAVMVSTKLAESKHAARRLIVEGAVRIEGKVVDDPAARLPDTQSVVLQVGPRRHVRLNLRAASSSIDGSEPLAGPDLADTANER
jgi:tyrosyl-tRNA synthetase